MYVKGFVNGVCAVIVVDSGCSSTCIAPHFVERLGVGARPALPPSTLEYPFVWQKGY